MQPSESENSSEEQKTTHDKNGDQISPETQDDLTSGVSQDSQKSADSQNDQASATAQQDDQTSAATQNDQPQAAQEQVDQQQAVQTEQLNTDETDDQAQGVTQGDSQNEGQDENQDEALDEQKPKKRHRARNIIIIVAAVVVALVIAGVVAYGVGVITPANAAAKYGTFDYLDESEVTDYIMTYKEQMGYGNATDDEWATFLATYNLTPDRLRLSTIEQLLSDLIVKKTAEEKGISVSDAEVDAIIDAFKLSLGIVDEDTWEATLEMYGQTEEGLRDVYSLELLKEKLCTQEVEMPTPTDDEVRSYIESFALSCQATDASNAATSEESQAIMNGEGEKLLRHSYCFEYDVSGDEASLADSTYVEDVRREFMESGTDVDTFMTVLGLYSNDEDAIENNGAMGWDADTTEYSDVYIRMLGTLSAPGVSSVFTDTISNKVCFIWVDETYDLPYAQDQLETLDLDAMPSTLHAYFSDCAAYELWEDASSEYLAELVANMPVTVYPMPSDVPYNVDMSPYLITEDEEDSESTDGSEESGTAVSDDESSDQGSSSAEEAEGSSGSSSSNESSTSNESSASDSANGSNASSSSGASESSGASNSSSTESSS